MVGFGSRSSDSHRGQAGFRNLRSLPFLCTGKDTHTFEWLVSRIDFTVASVHNTPAMSLLDQGPSTGTLISLKGGFDDTESEFQVLGLSAGLHILGLCTPICSSIMSRLGQVSSTRTSCQGYITALVVTPMMMTCPWMAFTTTTRTSESQALLTRCRTPRVNL